MLGRRHRSYAAHSHFQIVLVLAHQLLVAVLLAIKLEHS
jgi:hypothetical protein